MRRKHDLDSEQRWGLILAGGDGVRLRPLTLTIAGDERPKQFCAILGGETLLEGTCRRAARGIASGRTVVMLTRAHERFYAPLLGSGPPHRFVVQPENRGTAPAILYGLLHIHREAPTGVVAVLPTDHYVSDDAVFMDHVARAFAAVESRPDLVVLLGIAPESAEVEYGWIEPGRPLAGGLYHVSRFWEKPAPALAAALVAQGCYWNSFVMVARVSTLLGLTRAALPTLDLGFAAVRAALATTAEEGAVEWLYRRLRSTNFSRTVLAAWPSSLAVLPVTGVQWSDWGQPRRVFETLDRLGIRPEWGRPQAAPVPA